MRKFALMIALALGMAIAIPPAFANGGGGGGGCRRWWRRRFRRCRWWRQRVNTR